MASFSTSGLSCLVFCRYFRTKTLGAKWIMFCSPQPKGNRSSLSRLFRVGPITSPVGQHAQTKKTKKQNQPCQLCRSEREPFVTVSVTDHERRGLFGPGNRVVRDPQSEGFIVVLVRVLLPPDLKLPDRTPSCRKPYVTHLKEQEKKNVVIWSLKTNVH